MPEKQNRKLLSPEGRWCGSFTSSPLLPRPRFSSVDFGIDGDGYGHVVVVDDDARDLAIVGGGCGLHDASVGGASLCAAQEK